MGLLAVAPFTMGAKGGCGTFGSTDPAPSVSGDWNIIYNPQMSVVVKIGGIPWFNAMEVGIKQEAEKEGTNAWMVGPTQADAAQRGPDALRLAEALAAAIATACVRLSFMPMRWNLATNGVGAAAITNPPTTPTTEDQKMSPASPSFCAANCPDSRPIPIVSPSIIGPNPPSPAGPPRVRSM